MFELDALDHVAIRVEDVARSTGWYVEVLGLERLHVESWGEVPVFVRAGLSGLALFPRTASVDPQSKGLEMSHFAFRATRENFDKARVELQRRGIEVEFQDHEISHSIYFRDPDGYRVEITTYELG